MRALNALIVALFTGAMFFIAICVMPFWGSLPAQSYRQHFQQMGPFIGARMIPLMITAIGIAGITAYLEARQKRRTGMVVFLLLVLILPLYGIVHGPVNERILGSEVLDASVIESLRAQWGVWHWVRTGLGLMALLLSIFTLKKAKKVYG